MWIAKKRPFSRHTVLGGHEREGSASPPPNWIRPGHMPSIFGGYLARGMGGKAPPPCKTSCLLCWGDKGSPCSVPHILFFKSLYKNIQQSIQLLILCIQLLVLCLPTFLHKQYRQIDLIFDFYNFPKNQELLNQTVSIIIFKPSCFESISNCIV